MFLGFFLLMIFGAGVLFLGIFWAFFGDRATLILIGLVLAFSFIANFFSTHDGVKQSRIVGEYVIDKEFFSGPNANWQYEHYTLEITAQDKLIISFHDQGRIKSRDSVDIKYTRHYRSDRIRITGESQHHLFQVNPTLYRQRWSFYYCFNSTKYGNMFFRKKKWYQW